MSVAAQVDINLDQGADWQTQLVWTDGNSNPYFVVAPMRMEIRDEVGGVPVVLQTNDTSEDATSDPDNQSILYNSEAGLIQLQIRGEDTDKLIGGQYSYDLFIHYKDLTTGFIRKHRLLAGVVNVSQRTTKNI